VAASAPTQAATESASKQATSSGKPRARGGSRPATRKKTVQVLLAGKLETMLREADGLNVAAIAKQANARGTQVRDLLRDLEAAGQVRRSGVGRGSRWRLVTDEERIAERAAELEALSSRKA
jgi:predicted ArsR family transcriptional regulator